MLCIIFDLIVEYNDGVGGLISIWRYYLIVSFFQNFQYIRANFGLILIMLIWHAFNNT